MKFQEHAEDAQGYKEVCCDGLAKVGLVAMRQIRAFVYGLIC